MKGFKKKKKNLMQNLEKINVSKYFTPLYSLAFY